MINQQDNDFDRSPAAEQMYLQELRDFKSFLCTHTDMLELRNLNLLGVQFALCEGALFF